MEVNLVVFSVVLLVLVLFILYKYLTRNYNYWQERNVPYIKPVLFFGNILQSLILKKSIGELFLCFYKNLNAPYFGIYLLNQPLLMIKDPDLIKQIFIKDFNYFNDRYAISDEKIDSFSAHMLFFAKNPEWKFIRTKISPVYSSGKIKNMFCLISEAADDMHTYLNSHYVNKTVEIKDVCRNYATNVITSCAFGVRAHAFENDRSPFKEVARKMFDFDIKMGIQQTCYFIAHWMVKLFKFPFLHPEIVSFLRDAFWKTIEERNKSQYVRHDIIDIIKDFNNVELNNDFKFEGDKVLAQAAQFFLAGFETVSAAMSFALYELSLHPNIQNRLRDEIQSTITKYGGITYENLQEMSYLQMVFSETLRKYPVISFLDRVCVQNYNLPKSNLIIEKGCPIYISVLGLHYDPKYYPNPERFDPERFSKENKKYMHPCTYLPFGEGPRNCIGQRFGLIVSKLGLIEILKDFVVVPSFETPKSIQFSTKTVFLSSNMGIRIMLKKP